MKPEKDFEDFIRLLNVHKVQYLVVGAYAVSFYTRPRNTGDIDFFISNSKNNIKKLFIVLKEFGFESLDLNFEDFADEDTILQLGYEPVRIDLMTGISGVSFDQAYQNKTTGKIGSEIAPFISLDDLIENKRASNRTKDKSDLELLLKFKNN